MVAEPDFNDFLSLNFLKMKFEVDETSYEVPSR